MKRFFVSLLFGLCMLFVIWCAGYNFDERGYSAALSSILFLFVFGMTYSYPGWNK
jgi:hypothetical protein